MQSVINILPRAPFGFESTRSLEAVELLAGRFLLDYAMLAQDRWLLGQVG